MEPTDTTESSGPNLVRPYFLTAGRTQAVVELSIESTLELQPSAREKSWPVGDMPSRIIELGATPQSVAEVSLNFSESTDRVFWPMSTRPSIAASQSMRARAPIRMW